MNSSALSCHGPDRSFGPGVVDPACRGGFDFTVLFEETILSILPSACFLIIAPIQTAHVLKGAVRVRPTLFRTAKLAAICAYAGLQLALLVLWSSPSSVYSTPVVIASSTLGLCVALGLGVLSPIEHHKSPRPSFFITTYLLISVLFDAARARTAWLLASLGTKLLILGLEAADKRRFLIQSYRYLSRESTSGLLNRSLFWWLVPLLSDGWKRVLSVGDLFSINEKLTSRKVGEDLQTVWNQEKWQRRGLAASVMWAWRFEVAKILFPRFCLVALNLTQPFLIEKVVKTLSEPEGPQTRNTGYGMVGAVAIVYVGSAVSAGFHQHMGFRLMAMMRGGLISTIYQKALSLPSTDSGSSPVMTLLGTDVERICEIWHDAIAEIFPNIIQLGVAIWLLYRQMGAVCVAPVILVFVTTAISLKAASYVTTRQKQWLEAIQARISFTSHILGNMKSIKMLGLAGRFESMIQSLRIRELDFSKRFRRLSSFNVCLVNVPQHFSQFMTFAAFAIVSQIQGGSSFSVTQAVTSLAILEVLMYPLSKMIYAIPQAYAALGCFRRIEEFLLSSSWTDRRLSATTNTSRSTGSNEFPGSIRGNESIELQRRLGTQVDPPDTDFVTVTNASFGWRDASPVVKNISMSVTKDTPLTLILGPVGCGKSTLLKGLLGESLILEGTVQARTNKISFCDHNPWIVNASIRENITGESGYEETFYNSVINACALRTDLEQLPDSDETMVGSKGVTLSGGQKQRITIARAVYSRTQVAIFDDVLTGLDAVTQETLLARVFGPQGMLRKIGTITVLASHAVNKVAVADQVLVLDKEGHVVKQGPPDKITIPQDFIHPASTEDQNIISDKPGSLSTSKQPTGVQEPSPGDGMDQQRQVGDLSVYKFYFSSLGWLSLAIFAGAVIASSVFATLQYAWITMWSQHNDTSGNSDLGYWLGLYGFFGFIRTSCMIFAIYFMYVIIVPRSGQNLHLSVLQSVMRAPISSLSGTTTGSLINRFSQDMNLVDMTLPATLTNVAFPLDLTGCLGVAALAIVAVSYSAATMPLLFVAVYYLQRFYLRTSRQLRLLDLEAKAPLYSHVLESLDGMASIRAYGWSSNYIAKNLEHLDTAQKPYYLLLCIQQWLTLVLGLIVAAFTTILTILAVVLHGKVDAGFFGIALVSMEGFAHSLASLVAFWTKLETSLGAVSRVKTFSEDTLREESLDEGVAPPVQWPSHGSLEFKNWTAYHTESPVLQNINLSITGGEKVAICGRTGSGKSSLILSILGMVNTSSGQITVDDVDLSTIPREVIRKSVTCVTQDPFLFNGPVRQNADPLGESTDEKIIAALEKVGVWSAIRRGNGESGSLSPEQALDATVDDKFLSHGQRQLFCLGRALLRESRVLILDEPTSSVDASTEAQIQDIIDSDFVDSTVIMVTHKLSGVLKFDKVAVLDTGSLVEFGPPGELLTNPSGAFASLYLTQEKGSYRNPSGC
ncbi:ABC multidrug transporter [Podospora aff. communis PSN243]|uniref:ABC multidrug transporter n=1 Tax=Podospora aff. communis PSN243 TaxID=3040156 RepID=A0AAV9GAL0_9PEZI|nr:ABC multidrug transporter [Podospora aff. communis PSN243]